MAVTDRFEAPGATQHDWVVDGVLAGVLALSGLPYLAAAVGSSSLTYLAWLIVDLLMVAPLVLRRHYPLLMVAGCTVAGILQIVVSPWPMPSLVAVPIAAYATARWVPGHAARLVLYVGAVASLIGPARWWFSTAGGSNGVAAVVGTGLTMLVCFGLVVTPYALGRRVRESASAREQRMADAAERARMLAAEHEQRARMSEAQTRATIARELHDIVAHSLSVMIVQAEGGRALLTKKPEAAGDALDTIAATGREALTEMRRIVTVLRDGPGGDDQPADYAPAPGLADIPDLVHRTSDRATVRVDGTPPAVGQTLGLTAYRVVQEALTNFLKHAGPHAHAEVMLSYSPGLVVIEVVDDGRGAAVLSDGQGNGLRGMRERVAAMGGHLVAQPKTGGGFTVRVILPVSAWGQHQPGGVVHGALDR